MSKEFDEQDVRQFLNVVNSAESEVSKAIVGQKDVMRQVLISLFAGGHVLLEGVPGLGKTALVRAIGQALDLAFSRIQFTPDLMPLDIMGTNMITESAGTKSFEFQPGPVFANMVLADEINRATPKTQSALLEAMQERTVTVGNRSMQLPAPFFVLATQNPIEMEGTYPLPEAQLDRFLFKVQVTYPSSEELHEIIARTTTNEQVRLEAVASAADVLHAIRVGRATPCAKAVTDYAIRLALAASPQSDSAPSVVKKYVRYGPGPRAVQALVMAGRVRALMEGRLNVSFDDISYVLLPAFRHRIILGFEGHAEGVDIADIISALVEHVPESIQRTR